MCVKRFNQSLWVKDTYLEFPAWVRWCREEKILSVEQMGLEGAVVRGWGVEAGLARQIPTPVTLLHQHLVLELNILPGGTGWQV